MVLLRGEDTVGSPVSRVPGADVASIGDSNPARRALGGPRPCAAGTRPLTSHLSGLGWVAGSFLGVTPSLQADRAFEQSL